MTLGNGNLTLRVNGKTRDGHPTSANAIGYAITAQGGAQRVSPPTRPTCS